MANDFMMIISSLEKDKGIDKDILIEAIRSAIEGVARKTMELEEDYPVIVDINEMSGKITVSVDGETLRTDKLGRIAAQTAKQVIMQKMKEAETDVIYESYKDKKGELINGIIQRFEQGNIILEVGRTEAILMRDGQVFRDDYRINDRIRAYVTDVQRNRASLRLIVSRSNNEMVKKLFEFEVPEIAEGTVEIKGIVREAGDRTKIAVFSPLTNVDCVGACVGMRGSRVKSIVDELRGEKIDIVRWDPDQDTFIRNALNPAEVIRMNMNSETNKCEVVVAKDKLSLAIGKKGQNARLAAKLTGWDIDIVPETPADSSAIEMLFKDEMDDDTIEDKMKEAITHLIALEGIDDELAKLFVEAGFTTLEQIAEADVTDLTDITGVESQQALDLIASAKEKIGE